MKNNFPRIAITIKRRLIPIFVMTLGFIVASLSFSSCSEDEERHTKTYAPGDIVPAYAVESAGAKSFFSSSPISDITFALMQGKSFADDCTTPRDSLRYLRCLHTDKDGRIIVGEMVVNVIVADDVLDIFYQLYQAKYPIEKMC